MDVDLWWVYFSEAWNKNIENGFEINKWKNFYYGSKHHCENEITNIREAETTQTQDLDHGRDSSKLNMILASMAT